MKVRLKGKLLIVSGETDEEAESIVAWATTAHEHVFALQLQDGQTVRLTDLGPRAEACREPINVVSTNPDPVVQLISNLAHTPFELDARTYASVESFWQGLKFPQTSVREQIAPLHGHPARLAGQAAEAADTFEYEGQTVRRGTWDHWELMSRACRAKFTQHAGARQALLATGDRPLVHRVRRDSRNIPGAIMAEIWMRVRSSLVRANDGP